MPKRLFVYAQQFSGSYQMKTFEVHQGVAPVLMDLKAGSSWPAPSSYPTMSLSYSQDFMLASTGGGNGQFGWCYWPDPTDLSTYTYVATPLFSGSIQSVAASQSHYAVGGTAPYLYVLSRADHSLKTVNITGIGTVNAMAFSPSGEWLAVYHTTHPYLRIYKTVDWTYRDVAAAVAPSTPTPNFRAAAFTTDSLKLVVGNGSASYLNVYDVATFARLNTVGGSNSGVSKIVTSKANVNEVFVSLSDGGSPLAARYNVVTNALTLTTGGPNVTSHSIALDEAERELHVSSSNAAEVWMHRVNADTMALIPAKADVIFQTCRATSMELLMLQTTPHTIEGTVRDIDNNPAPREVLAIERATGVVRAKAISNAVTGDYQLRVDRPGPFDVQFKILDGEQLNDLFYARVEAKPV